jgi:hypothetical protein
VHQTQKCDGCRLLEVIMSCSPRTNVRGRDVCAVTILFLILLTLVCIYLPPAYLPPA